ncbi:MAG: retropepsin-like domain-containing protein [Oscillospiraceae bacterium]|nr:retropepsin-like domain-containing protein [Oscillospiraceae bacterium]
MDVYFGDDSFYILKRQGGALHITLNALHSGGTAAGSEIKFILDTGAYISIISRGTALQLGYDKLPKTPTILYGFGGAITADFVRIPGLIILGKTRVDVPVAIPHDMYRVNPKTGEKKQVPDVLGLSILEYYNFYISTEKNLLYLADNPTPTFYSKELESGQVFALPNEETD